MFPPKDVRKLLGVSPSTLARYGNLFGEFLSQGATRKGRKRTYTEGDINTLQHIQALYQQKLSTEEIRKALSGKSLATRGQLPLLPAGLSDALTKIDDKFASQEEKITGHDERLAAMEKYLQDLEEWDALGFWEKRRTPKPKRPR